MDKCGNTDCPDYMKEIEDGCGGWQKASMSFCSRFQPAGETGKTSYHDTAQEIADLVVEKQAAYGDSFGKARGIIKILYPEGVQPDQYQDFLTVVRVIDKLFRVATDRDALGESPWRDIQGYALLATVRNQKGDAE